MLLKEFDMEQLTHEELNAILKQDRLNFAEYVKVAVQSTLEKNKIDLQDAARLDFLAEEEASILESYGAFSIYHPGYSRWDRLSPNQEGYPTARAAIDAAMQAKESK
jgi:hypothetical protein